MDEVNIFPLSENHELRVDAAFEPSDAIKARVDQIWSEERKKSGNRLTNGKIYCLSEHRPDFLLIQPSEYRYVLAQRRAPDLVDAGLRIQPLAVTGVMLCADGIVLGRRSDKVSSDPGLWEPAPAGGLSQPDPNVQVLEELEEELGLDPSRINFVKICGLVEDGKSGVFDIVFLLHTAALGEEIQATYKSLGSDEYSEISIIKPANVPAFLNTHSDNLLSALRPMLGLVGLL